MLGRPGRPGQARGRPGQARAGRGRKARACSQRAPESKTQAAGPGLRRGALNGSASERLWVEQLPLASCGLRLRRASCGLRTGPWQLPARRRTRLFCRARLLRLKSAVPPALPSYCPCPGQSTGPWRRSPGAVRRRSWRASSAWQSHCSAGGGAGFPPWPGCRVGSPRRHRSLEEGSGPPPAASESAPPAPPRSSAPPPAASSGCACSQSPRARG
mmetsp:Transcript_38683/g.84401  ORF Transcript_38683/g.84401 Transcript_38683/m.84401 type:complete len:215 (+) Transcript_38683:225-869(+)